MISLYFGLLSSYRVTFLNQVQFSQFYMYEEQNKLDIEGSDEGFIDEVLKEAGSSLGAEAPKPEPEPKTEPKPEPKPEPEPKTEPKHEHKEHKAEPHKEHRPKKPFLHFIKDIYEHKYRKLLIIPFLLLVLAFAQMGIQYAATGDFINRGISLKGGLSLTIPTDSAVNIEEMREFVQDKFPDNDINVRTLTSGGYVAGIIVEADIDITDNDAIDLLIDSSGSYLGIELTKDDYTIEGIGSSLGASFFLEASIAMLIAFLFMGIVVFLYFRSMGPSLAVILAAFSDIIETVAVVNLIGMKMSTSGIVALLLLIGYSVDTDILLSTRVLRHKEGSIMQRVYSSMKTGLTMTATTIAAVSVALIFTDSIVIKQIMIILLIGLVFDVVNTYIQNVGLIRMFVERSKK